jgi:hypothetical protein
MKKIVLFPVLLLSIACTQVNKPLTDADKEKITGEAKVLIDSIMKHCENPNPEALIALYINSPDFVTMVGGVQSDYAGGCEGARNYLNSVTRQKATITKEKYTVLDPTTVLYTADSKWEVVTKNDSTTMMDPVGMQFLLKKVDNEWKVLSWTEEM